MPENCRFFGIIITMYYDDHAPPHFHVRYGAKRDRFTIEPLAMLDGEIGPKTRALVIDWGSMHAEELRKEWSLARARSPLFKIAPLE